jgi:type IV secretory pathway protease TraF
LTVRNSRVYVTTSQGPLALGAYAHADSEGRLLPRAALPERIPLGHYFIGVPEKPNSLDSRYLGLVSSAQINSRLYPIWTW